MKKTIRIFSIILLLVMIFFTTNTYAVSLNSLDIQLSELTVRPGEQVTVFVQFGESLGNYTVSIAYDNNIFEYISSDGGTPEDTGDKVKIVHDNTGGINPRSSMNVTFRAKADITTSNPTNFAITLEGLSNSNSTLNFDSITTPIIKNVMVEPEFVDYTINLEYIGDIIKGEEKEVQISFSSPIGRYYPDARLVATATTPANGDVELIAIDNMGLKHDIIDSGWGDAGGFGIGGKSYSQVLSTTANFSEVGDYSINLKLIDRDNSDATIAERSFAFSVGEAIAAEPMLTSLEPSTENQEAVGSAEPAAVPQTPTTETASQPSTQSSTQTNNQVPQKLPKTGGNIYFVVTLVLIALLGGYLYYNKDK